MKIKHIINEAILHNDIKDIDQWKKMVASAHPDVRFERDNSGWTAYSGYSRLVGTFKDDVGCGTVYAAINESKVTEALPKKLAPGKKVRANAVAKSKFQQLASTGLMSGKVMALQEQIKKLKEKFKKNPKDESLLAVIFELNEEIIQIGKATHYYNLVTSQCGDYIKIRQKTNKRLFRGMKIGMEAFKGKPRTDRRPKDSSKKQQEEFDSLLKAGKFKALRSNSIFTTTKEVDADEYGDVYEIFPLNGYAITWSTVIKDLYIDAYDDHHNLISYFSGTDNFDLAEEISDETDTITDFYEGLIELLEVKSDDPKIKPVALKLIRYFKSAQDYFYNLDSEVTPYKIPDYKKHISRMSDVKKVTQKVISAYFKKEKTSHIFARMDNLIKLIKEHHDLHNMSTNDKIKRLGLVNGNLENAMRSGHEIYLNSEYYAFAAESRDRDDRTLQFLFDMLSKKIK